MMTRTFLISLLVIALGLKDANASVFLPYDVKKTSAGPGSKFCTTSPLHNSNLASRDLARMRQAYSTNRAAMAIPGYGLTEQIFVGGFATFLSIYNLVITARILLSWIPQAQEVALLQPVYQITDPYLNLFRGLIPPVFGLDLSPLLAFFLLSALTNATAAVGAEITPEMGKKLAKKYSPFSKKKQRTSSLGF